MIFGNDFNKEINLIMGIKICNVCKFEEILFLKYRGSRVSRVRVSLVIL